MCYPPSSKSTEVQQNASTPSRALMTVFVTAYVLSGICQPLLMSILKHAGLADSKCQLFMMFYYLGPSTLLLTLLNDQELWSFQPTLWKAAGIALFDLMAQTMNYTGASLAGPTIFAIVYSSVAIWTAVFSRCVLGRWMNEGQWMGIWIVFGGLALTATDSMVMGSSVVQGTMLVLVGSMAHALTYVLSEAVMHGPSSLNARQNSAIQSVVGFVCLAIWQLLYTVPRFDELILEPVERSGTPYVVGVLWLIAFAVANLVHSYAFFLTVKYCPGGSTSAGVMKGLQAVMVFLLSAELFCGRIGGDEMCFSSAKFISLVVVVIGVSFFALATKNQQEKGSKSDAEGYARIESVSGLSMGEVA